MADGVRGGITLDEVAADREVAARTTAAWTRIELTAGSSLVNPMYLFRGEAPVKEFAGAFKPPLRWGIRMTGKKFLREYPYREAYLLRDARQFRAELTMPLILLGGITNRETDGPGDGRGLRVRRDGRGRCWPSRTWSTASRPTVSAPVHSACTHCNKCMPTIYSRTHCVVTGAPDAVDAGKSQG